MLAAAGLNVFKIAGGAVVPLVNVLVAVGMLGIVPAGLALAGGVPLWLRRAWFVGAAWRLTITEPL